MDNRSKVWVGVGLLLVAVAFLAGWWMFGGRGPQAEGAGQEVEPAVAGAPVRPVAAVPVSVVGLKDAYAGKLRVGTTLDGGTDLSERELALVRQNFNVLMPENCMTPGRIHPSEATWNWEAADRLMEFAVGNGQQVMGHTLVWHAQTGSWFFQGDGGGAVSREVLTERLKTHIQTLVGWYKGRVMGWNVVNEPINDGAAAGGGENLRNSNWLRILGPEYIGMAFRFAHEADPGAMLFYNDYNIEKGAKHDSSMALLRRLVKEGVPVNGVGIQGHWSLTVSAADLEKAIVDYQSLGLKVAISELDITVTGANSGAFPAPGSDPLDRQAEAYRQVMKVVLAHREAISHVVFWGVDDRRSWKATQKPTLFDGEGQAKPAWQAVMDLGKG